MEGEKSGENLHNVLKINLGWFCSSLLSLCLLSSLDLCSKRMVGLICSFTI